MMATGCIQSQRCHTTAARSGWRRRTRGGRGARRRRQEPPGAALPGGDGRAGRAAHGVDGCGHRGSRAHQLRAAWHTDTALRRAVRWLEPGELLAAPPRTGPPTGRPPTRPVRGPSAPRRNALTAPGGRPAVVHPVRRSTLPRGSARRDHRQLRCTIAASASSRTPALDSCRTAAGRRSRCPARPPRGRERTSSTVVMSRSPQTTRWPPGSTAGTGGLATGLLVTGRRNTTSVLPELV